MADPFLVGRGPRIRVPSAGGSWRGLSLTFASAGFSTNPATMPVPWDTIVVDTDGIASTGVHSEGGFSVPIGAAGVVPAGMAGLWRFSADIVIAATSSSSGDFAFLVVCNGFDWFFGNQVSGQMQDSFQLPIPAFVRTLAEGDVIWCIVGAVDIANSAGSSDSSAFLMEYLGPTP